MNHMELQLHITPDNVLPPTSQILSLHAHHTDTIATVKHRLAKQLNNPDIKNCFFVWAGSVIPDTSTISDAGLKPLSTVCLVPPSVSVNGASTESLKIFQQLQYHHHPASNQAHPKSPIDLINAFTTDLSDSRAPWAPVKTDIELLHWVINVLRNASPPSIKYPAITWFGEYGCALVSRTTQFEDIIFSLVCLDKWSFDIHSAPVSRVHTSCADNHDFVVLFVGSVPQDRYNSFIGLVNEKLKKVQQRKKKQRTSATGNQGHHKTPGMIQAIMKEVLSASQKDYDDEAIPMGGFTDVGLHTGGHARNTSWHLALGVISHLLDSEDKSKLFRQVTLQLPLRIAEHSVMHFLSKIRDPSSELSRNSDTSRQLTNSIMQTLCHVAQEAQKFEEIHLSKTEFVLFEARCIRVRYELDYANKIRSKRMADQYILPSLSPDKVAARDFSLSIPGKNKLRKAKQREDTWKLACSNLSLLPAPPSPESIWDDMEGWMKQHCCAYDDNYVKQQVICKAVEVFFFRKIMDHTTDSRPRQVEEIVDQYRKVARKLQECKESRYVLRGELMSKELLVVWIAYCLVHAVAKKNHSLLSDYSVPLQVNSLRFLVLTEMNAVNAARKMAQYLLENATHQGPVFSCLSSDKTLDFALKRGQEIRSIVDMRDSELRIMKERQESRWSKIQTKQQKLISLDRELRDLEEEYCEVSLEEQRLYQEWQAEAHEALWLVSKPQILIDTIERKKDLESMVSNKKSEIRTEERAPPPILQPLPSDANLAMKVLFFLNMPSDLKILSRLGFTAQQILLPCQKIISVNISPDVVAEFKVDNEISLPQPKTLWYDYYVSESSVREYDSFATRNGVVLGSCHETPAGDSWYSSTVRNISSSSDGVWYPNSLEPRLFWNGGGCELDVRQDGEYFNPFKEVSPLISIYKFTEPLPTENDDSESSLQWSLYQKGKDTAATRGNYALASQDRMVGWLPSKNSFLEFCAMRAYPFQQMRRLCATLSTRSLPLMSDRVRVLIQQTMHQLGQVSSDERTEREWHTDLNNFDGWKSLRTILRELCEELRGKPREHTSILTLGELAAQASQWDPGCRMIAREFASIAEKAADELAGNELRAGANDAPSFRARRCILYMICLNCHSAGEISRSDVYQMIKAHVMAEYTRLFEDPNPYDTEVRNLTTLTMSLMAVRMSEVLKEVLECPQILTEAVRNVLEAAPDEIYWKMITLQNGSATATTSGFGEGADKHEYFIDLNVGTVLVDGCPPCKLPKSILSSRLFRRSFGNRNFEVFMKTGGILATTRRIAGKFYEFAETQDGLLIMEIDGSDSGSSLELLDVAKVRSWGNDLPKRLKMMHSHWLCRKTNTIVLRPKYFRQREVQYVLVHQVHGNFAPEASSISGNQMNWSCFKIPTHLQKKDWLAPDRDFSKLNKLVYLIDETSLKLLSLIRKFERTEGCIQALRTVQNSFLIVLPRFGLEFELAEDGSLKSRTFSSYKLWNSQNFDDTLIDFSEYLILESQGMKKVLIPAGHVDEHSGTIFISGSEAIDSSRRFHVYSAHPRFETLDPVPGKYSIEARLQLGALYAATGTTLPEKRIGKTGGEHAIELMRQSWQNCPMSKAETDHLESISSFGKLCPTLNLLAYELFSSSQKLHFLPFGAETGGDSISLKVEAATEYILRKKRLQLNPRAFLSEDEENYVLSSVITPSSQKKLQQEGDIEINRVSFGTTMDQISRILKKMLHCAKDVDSGPEFPFETNEFGNTSIGTKIGTELRESWDHFVKLPIPKLSTDLDKLAEELKTCLVRCTDYRTSIEREIYDSLGRVPSNGMEESFFNMRRAANLEPQCTRRDLLKISCDTSDTSFFNPFLTQKLQQTIRSMILEWMQVCVMEDKLSRMLTETKRRNTIELVRELQEVERRWDVAEHVSWLALEVEEQLQIRDLQYNVAEFCLRNPGKITQLNMGEGKTRVILPMLILELAKRDYLIRIHFLSPLLSEATEFLHHTITASTLNRRFLRLPFHRDIKLNRLQAVKILQSLRRGLDNGSVVCIAPEHRLSLLLKKSELDIRESGNTVSTRRVLQQIYDLPYFDLFDESDELLHHRYQLIYAVGACIPLSSGRQRWVALQAVLQKLQSSEKVAAVLEAVAKRDKVRGRLLGSMDSIRLLQDCTEEQHQTLVSALATAISQDPPYHMRWLKGNSSIDDMISFVTDKDKSLEWLRDQVADGRISKEQTECLLVLRGILAYGLLRHCISLRYRVDYGIDPRRRSRRVAVPYRGSDMPSDRAEYAHPDIQIIFTHLAYYYKGLSKQEVMEAVQALLELGPIAQREEYKEWFTGATSVKKEKRQLIDGVDKLDISNATQMKLMHEVYQFNMATISFWLDAWVLPKETMQFPKRLTANAFHLAENKDKNIIGFSGTRDNNILLPAQVVQELPDILQVKATDGKMVHLILKNPVVHCLSSSTSLSESVLLMCVEKKVSALIDAGALMSGLENEEVAQQMLSLIEIADGHAYQGVVYFEKEKSSWMVLSVDGRYWPLGNSPIHERDSFVFFDESHCRGADMKLRNNALALLTVGPNMGKDKLMQAAGRMRKLDRGQSLIFAVPAEIGAKIPVTNGSSLTSKEVLKWVIGNTARAAAKGLISWGSQGSLYCTTQDLETRLTDEVLELEELYHSEVQVKTISDIVGRFQRTYKQHVENTGKRINDAANKMMGKIMEHARKYGADQKLILSQADEECEREIEHERELEREREVMIPRKIPCSQAEWDFDALLYRTSSSDVIRMTNAISISQAMKGCFRNLKVGGISWENCCIYLTTNFIGAVTEEDGTEVQNFSNYLRPVDTVIFFRQDTCCLLLSEWEADKILRRVWRHCAEHDEKEMLITYTNFAFLFPLEPSQDGAACHLSIPRSNIVGRDVTGKASEYTLAGLQLFGGQTMFYGEERRAALKEMLDSDQAKRSALRLVSLRGSGRMIARSDLEDICSLHE